ncbi:hypothetical protein ABEB36_006300 [Hypothenemus hampei]|uniref:Uncharacterized protein n=1 Tax=Hypothenemus hampei TaxID=57062 RepID=A0ABD1EQ32_HYPHA
MPSTSSLMGSATRYISGRNAMQTVYWIRPTDGNQHKFLKLSKTCNFQKGSKPPRNVQEMQHRTQFYDN